MKKMNYKKAASYVTLFMLTACTRTCVGLPELGSKNRPVKIYINGKGRDNQLLHSNIADFSSCLEEHTHYSIQMEVVAGYKLAIAALQREDAEFTFIPFDLFEIKETKAFLEKFAEVEVTPKITLNAVYRKTLKEKVAALLVESIHLCAQKNSSVADAVLGKRVTLTK